MFDHILQLRFALFSLLTLMLLDCPGCNSPRRTMSTAEKKAIQAAKQWTSSQGLDPAAAEYSATPDGTGWSILMERKPATPGGHTQLKIDSNGKVTNVFGGA